MIRGIGVDVSAVIRWEDEDARARLMRAAFSEEEAAWVRSRGAMAPQSAAGLFCAKEAFLKALGTGLGGVHMRDIVIGHTPAGAPCYVMNGAVREALERFDADSAFLSISHDGGIAAAFCVIGRGEGGPCSDT